MPVQSSSHPSEQTRFEHQFTGKKSGFSPVDLKTQKITLKALVAHLQAEMVEYQVFSIDADYRYLQGNT